MSFENGRGVGQEAERVWRIWHVKGWLGTILKGDLKVFDKSSSRIDAGAERRRTIRPCRGRHIYKRLLERRRVTIRRPLQDVASRRRMKEIYDATTEREKVTVRVLYFYHKREREMDNPCNASC